MPDNTRIMLLINPSRGYTRGLLSGFAQYAHLRASWTFYRPLEYRDKVGRSIVRILRKLKPDGIFMREPPELDRIIDIGVPIVCSPYRRDTIPGVANIVTDHDAIGRVTAEHLLSQGLRNFAYCTFDNWWWSRRLLEKRFRRLVGHSIHREIQRVKADFTTRMLLETNMPISQIAEAMQFTDVAHLARFFREEQGCSPTQYRLRHVV